MGSMKNEPVLIVMAIMAALQALVAGAAWAEYVPTPWAQLSALVVAAAQVGLTFYVRGQVVPLAKIDSSK